MSLTVTSTCFLILVFSCQLADCYWLPINLAWLPGRPRIQRGYSSFGGYPELSDYRIANAPLSGLPPRSANSPYNHWRSPFYHQVRYETAERAIFDAVSGRIPSLSGPRYFGAHSTGRIASYVNSDRVAQIHAERASRFWPY